METESITSDWITTLIIISEHLGMSDTFEISLPCHSGKSYWNNEVETSGQSAAGCYC